MSERHHEQLNDTEGNNIRALHQSEVQMQLSPSLAKSGTVILTPSAIHHSHASS